MVKSPEIPALLMIVEDNEEHSGKRTLLLNNELKNIEISNEFVEWTFVAYFVFSR